METTLYEFSFYYAGLVGIIVPLLVSIVLFFANEIVGDRKVSKSAARIAVKEISPKTFKIFTRIIGGFLSVACFIFVVSYIKEYRDYKTRLDNGDVFVVEGYVTDFERFSSIEKTPEHFEINGVYFAYRERDNTNGYHSVGTRRRCNT